MGASRAPACVTPFALPLLLVLAAPWALAQPASDRPDPRPMVTAQPATVKPLLEHSSGSAPTLQLSQAEITTLLRLQIKYVFVIFNENHSFDNEFGTFPGVNGIYSDGQAPCSAANTAGFTQTSEPVPRLSELPVNKMCHSQSFDFHFSLDVRRVVLDDRRVRLREERRRDDEIRSRTVAGDRYVVDDRDPEKGLDVDVVRVRLHRIPEEDHDVDPALGDHRAELLIAPERPGLEPRDLGNRS